jgi:hypothetical protein
MKYKPISVQITNMTKPKSMKINSTLKAGGVKTWFFPEDNLPGEKLHRVMNEGDRMIEREDIKRQITSRVIRKLDDSNFDSEFDRAIKVLGK